jgi:hypothetical protein
MPTKSKPAAVSSVPHAVILAAEAIAVGPYACVSANKLEWAALGALWGFVSSLVSVWLASRKGKQSRAKQRG